MGRAWTWLVVALGGAALLAPGAAAARVGIRVERLGGPFGDAGTGSRITLRLDAPARVVHPEALTLVGLAARPDGGPPLAVPIPITSVGRRRADPRLVVLTTLRLAPRGAILSVPRGALLAGGRPVPPTLRLPQGVSAAEFSLAFKPLVPLDASLFARLVYPGPVPDLRLPPPLSPADVAARLEATLGARVRGGRLSAGKAAAMRALLDDPGLVGLVPDPSLRAGLLSLAGTDLEPALDVALGRRSSMPPFGGATIWFGSLARVATIIGGAGPGPDGRLHGSVYMPPGAPPQLLGAVLGAGILVPNTVRGGDVLRYVLLAVGWAEMLRDEPPLAAPDGLEFAAGDVRFANTLVLGLLNSGRRGFPRPGVDAAPGVATAFPGGLEGGSDLKGLATQATREFDFTFELEPPAEANEPLRAALGRLTGRTGVGPLTPGDAVDLLDRGIVSITPAEQLRIAGALRLALPLP